LSSVAVPAGTTLDLTGLKQGTTVRDLSGHPIYIFHSPIS
jgi:hypothetical protein